MLTREQIQRVDRYRRAMSETPRDPLCDRTLTPAEYLSRTPQSGELPGKNSRDNYRPRVRRKI